MMKRRCQTTACAILALSLCSSTFAQDQSMLPQPNLPTPRTAPLLIPQAPDVDAKAFMLIDASSGKILAQKNADEKLPPASLTKMMTLYIIADALASGRIHLDDKVTISNHAWRMGGSKMFVKVGEKVPVKDLVQGIIVASGNDACVAMAEYIAGAEDDFVNIMNQQAQLLGMSNTHFTDCTGMPHPDHYSTPHDLALLARAIVKQHPDFYKQFFAEKWFTWNGIRQPNRNRLLWRDSDVDGIKTGHTNAAGYCLVSSGLHDGMRLVSVVMGAPSDEGRTQSSQRLLSYGFRFYETHTLYQAGAPLASPRVWLGQKRTVPLGITKDIVVTIPSGQYKQLKASMELDNVVKAPVAKLQPLGNLVVTLDDKVIAQSPLVALESDTKGSLWQRFSDSMYLFYRRMVGHKANA